MLDWKQRGAELVSTVGSEVTSLMGEIASLRFRVRRDWPVMTAEGKYLLYFLLVFFPTGWWARASDTYLRGFESQLCCSSARAQPGGRTRTVP